MNFGLPGYSGGLDIYARQLVEALADFGQAHDYRVFLYDYSLANWRQRTWPAHVQLVPLLQGEQPVGRVKRWQRRLQRWAGKAVPAYDLETHISQQIDAAQLDVVHFPGTTLWPAQIRAPKVLTFFDMQHEYFPEYFTQAELAERTATYKASVAKANRIVTPSSFTRTSLVEKYQVPENKLIQIPAGIYERERPTMGEVQRVRQKYKLPERYIYFPANTWPHKNHARLMAALRVYAERFGECPHLVLSGRLHNEVRDPLQLAVAAGVESKVTALGFVESEDVPALFAGAQALIFPSLFEGFGIPLVEAMLYDCPIVAANATAIPECVGDAAVLFDPLSPDSMAECLHALLTDVALQESLKAKGTEQVKAYYWRNLVPHFEALYSQVAGN